MIVFGFILSLSALLLQGLLVPKLSLFVFAPFLALLVLRRPLSYSLWLAGASGAIMDLFSDDPIGLYALNFTLATAFFLRFRTRFSSDSPLHFPLLTTLISILATLLQWLLLFLFDRRVPFHGQWILTDLIGMPIADGIFAFVWFTGPLLAADKLYKMWVLFWLKKKNPSLASR